LVTDWSVILGLVKGYVERPCDKTENRVCGTQPLAAFDRNPACIAFAQNTPAPLTDPLDPAFVREFQESTLARPLPEAAMNRIVAEGLKALVGVWKAAWAGLLEADLTPDLARIKAPTLLVWGDRDNMALRSVQDILRRSIPNVRFAVFKGAGHAPHWEELERFADLVIDFVNRSNSAGC